MQEIIVPIINKLLFFFKITLGGYLFDSTGNNLNINAGSLAYYANVIYQFTIQTAYLGITYSQVVTIQVGQFDALPITNLG